MSGRAQSGRTYGASGGPAPRVAIALPVDGDVRDVVGDAHDPAKTLNFVKIARGQGVFVSVGGRPGEALFQTLFSSPCWTRCLRVSRMGLLVWPIARYGSRPRPSLVGQMHMVSPRGKECGVCSAT
jgi:hypothetical protein